MPQAAADRQRQLLHQGGTAASWGNLGLWPEAPDDTDYAGACRALALAVGQAAQLQPGARVLSVACGAGDELLLWARHLGARAVVGTERDPSTARQAAVLTADTASIQVLCRPALATPFDAPFDAVVCVDAAYHFAARAAWLAQAWHRLRPGGRLAYCDLTLAAPASPLLRATAAPLLRGAARLCGVPATDLLPLPQQVQRLQALGFTDVQAQVLDAQVLGGFARFVRHHAAAQRLRPWQAGWRAAATTAALIPPCRAAGLGYALLSAMRPAAAPAG